MSHTLTSKCWQLLYVYLVVGEEISTTVFHPNRHLTSCHVIRQRVIPISTSTAAYYLGGQPWLFGQNWTSIWTVMLNQFQRWIVTWVSHQYQLFDVPYVQLQCEVWLLFAQNVDMVDITIVWWNGLRIIQFVQLVRFFTFFYEFSMLHQMKSKYVSNVYFFN